MSLNIKSPEAHKLAQELAEETGQSMTRAVTEALREAVTKARRQRGGRDAIAEKLNEIAKHCASLTVLDDRSPDEILGYDDRGLPG